MRIVSIFCSKVLNLFKLIIATAVTVFFFFIIIIGILNAYKTMKFGSPSFEFVLLLSCWLLLASNEGFQVGR